MAKIAIKLQMTLVVVVVKMSVDSTASVVEQNAMAYQWEKNDANANAYAGISPRHMILSLQGASYAYCA